MAVAPKHGKSSRVLVDEKDLSDFLRTVNASASMDPSEVTTFGDNDRSYIPGLRDGTLSFDGLFAASTVAVDDVANYFDGALGGSTKQVVTGDIDRSTGGRARGWARFPGRHSGCMGRKRPGRAGARPPSRAMIPRRMEVCNRSGRWSSSSRCSS